MKKLYKILSIAGLIILSSCFRFDSGEGIQGPQGPAGPQGAKGESGYVIEYENINFTAPDYEVLLNYPADFEGLASDVTLVYFLWDVQTVDGEQIEIWRMIPQSVITDYGTLLYNYDFTKYDTRLFMQGSFPLDWLSAVDTDQWIVRVVVVPGNFVNGRVDFSNYDEVKEIYGLPEFPIRNQKIKRNSNM